MVSWRATKATPWLIAAGEVDFGRSGATALHERLIELGATVQYREYPAIEHMVIIQAAPNDVFAFLDSHSSKP